MSIQCQVCLTENPTEQITCIVCGSPLVAEATYHLASGTVLVNQQNQYRIEKTLGTGGFGITYKGVNLKTSQPVAIKENWPENGIRQGSKIIWPARITPQEQKEQINSVIREAQYLQQCNHPNIVTVYDFFTANNTAYIIMEFVAGKSLYDLLKEKGKLPEEMVKKYFMQIAEALKEIHSKRLLHRDIKPDNIIITKEDKAVLIDFGNAREFIANKTQTMTKTLTRGYAPPEQYSLKGRKGAALDIYACCASMYELLTGQLPVDAYDRLTSDTLIPPRQIVPNLSPNLEKVILTGLRMKVEDRFQTAEALREALKGNYISPLLEKARLLAKEAKLSEAVEAYRKCLANEPQNGDAVVELAMVLMYHNSDRQAEAAATEAIQLKPKDGRGYGILGLINCRRSNWQDAYGYLQTAVNLSPSESWIQANLAWVLGKLGKWQEAEIAASKAMQMDNLDPFILSLQAWISANQQQWKNTIRFARLSLFQGKQKLLGQDLNSLQSTVYPCLLVALDKAVVTQQAPDVERCLQEFLSVMPDNHFACGFKAWKQAKEGDWQQALFTLKQINFTGKIPAWLLINQGIIQERLGNLHEAFLLYDQYNQQDNNNSFVLFRLGTISAKIKQWQAAKTYLEAAIKLNPNYAEAYQNLGWVLLNIKNTQGELENVRQLITAYRQAVQLYKEQYKFNLAESIEQAFQKADVSL